MFTSILRTVVPALWAAFINWVLVIVPVLEPNRDELLGYGLPLAVLASAVLTAAWYAFWRWLEPRLPDWLTRAVLGSARTPNYDSTRKLSLNISGNADIETTAKAIALHLARAQAIDGGRTIATSFASETKSADGEDDDEDPKHRAN